MLSKQMPFHRTYLASHARHAPLIKVRKPSKTPQHHPICPFFYIPISHQLCSSSSSSMISVCCESIESLRDLVSVSSSWLDTLADSGLCTRTTRGDSRGNGRCCSSERGTVVWPVRTL